MDAFNAPPYTSTGSGSPLQKAATIGSGLPLSAATFFVVSRPPLSATPNATRPANCPASAFHMGGGASLSVTSRAAACQVAAFARGGGAPLTRGPPARASSRASPSLPSTVDTTFGSRDNAQSRSATAERAPAWSTTRPPTNALTVGYPCTPYLAHRPLSASQSTAPTTATPLSAVASFFQAGAIERQCPHHGA